MAIRQQIVYCGVSCSLALSGSALAADSSGLGSDVHDRSQAKNASVSCVCEQVNLAGSEVANALPQAVAIIGTIPTAGAGKRNGAGQPGGTDAVAGLKDDGDFQTPDRGSGYFRLTAVPEPTAALIGSLGLLALVRRRRG
jgi:hypothetical protein